MTAAVEKEGTPGGALVRIVDDSEALRESLSFMLASEGLDVRTFESAEAFLAEDLPSEPGCLVLDVAMPGMSGIELQKVLLARGRTIPVIFLTAHGDIGMAVDAMLEGAFGFEQKPVKPERLLKNIRAAIEQDLASRGLAAAPSPEAGGGRATFTGRERDVLRLASRGLKSREIADELGISQRTVEHYRMSGLRKAGVKSAAELDPAAFEEL